MPNWRRAFVPGGTFFLTIVTERRAPFLCDIPARALITSFLRRCQMRWPMRIDALVLLPDHYHTIWSLPPGDAAYPKRHGWIKKEFTKQWLKLGGQEQQRSLGQINDGRRAVWQTKYWEHTIESPEDFESHFDYIHYNPVKHGYVRCPTIRVHLTSRLPKVAAMLTRTFSYSAADVI